jgi:hypothetical protein
MSARPPRAHQGKARAVWSGSPGRSGRLHLETGNVHSTISGECPHAHMMTGHDRRIDTDLHPGVGRRVEYYCRSTRGFSLHNRVKSLRSRPPPQCPANGRLTNRRENPRACAPVGRSPTTLPITCAGTNGRPCLWVIRYHVMTGPRGGSAPTTNSLNRAFLEETGLGRRSLSRAQSSPGNRRHRSPSQGHPK